MTVPAKGKSAIRYIERQPAAALAPWILSYWGFQSDIAPPADDPYTVWPDGCLTIGLLRVPHAPAMIVCIGPRFTAVQPPVSAMGRLWGIRLWPDAIEPVLGIEARTLRGHAGPAPADLWRRFSPLATALPVSDDPDIVFPALESWLLRELPLESMTAPDPCVRTAVQAIVTARGEVSMETVAREASIGLRQLQRRFPRLTGLTLREYARVRRLRATLGIRLQGAALPGGWSRIAAEAGFADHAHLSREFVALTGLSPSAAARNLERTIHDDVVP